MQGESGKRIAGAYRVEKMKNIPLLARKIVKKSRKRAYRDKKHGKYPENRGMRGIFA